MQKQNLIQRTLYIKLAKKLLRPGKVLFIVGPRQAGKTTFLHEFASFYLKTNKNATIQMFNSENLPCIFIHLQ